MLQNHLKIAVRNLRQRKSLAFLSLIGLTVGFTAGILIFQYVAYERSFDSFNENSDHKYRVSINSYQAGELTERSATAYPALGPAAKQSIPEVDDYTRLFKQSGVLRLGEKKFREEYGYLADASVLSFFDIRMILGDKNSLKTQKSIVISESIAKKYFGNTLALDREIEFENETYTIRGIFQDYPFNSHLKISYLLSYPENELMQQSWRWRNFYTYLTINPGADIAKLQQKLNQLLAAKNSNFYQQEDRRDEVSLQPLESIHLYSHLDKEIDVNGNAISLIFLLTVGIFIVVISLLNYVNLTLANASCRNKEIGVKKILGSSKTQLLKQFFIESLLINCMAVVFAAIVITAINPWFREFSGIPQSTTLWTMKEFILLSVPILLTGLLITGLYPSIIISRFQPVTLIKGIVSAANQPFSLRKGFILFQFFLATVLIIGVMVIYKQLNYMISKDPGFNTEQIIVVRVSGGNDDSLRPVRPFKNDLLEASFINGVSNSAFVPGQEVTRIRGIKRKEAGSSAYHTFANTLIDYDFVDLYKLKLLAGRDFSRDNPSDVNNVLLNEEAVKILGFQNADEAINKEIINGDRDPDTLRITGVLENFHQRGVQFTITPMVFLLGTDDAGFYSIKMETSDWKAAIGFIEKKYDKHFADSPFEFFFLDDYFDRQYQNDKKFGTLFGLFTAIAIWISCLGLFSMVKFLAEQRTKEIGIRKVLGASVLNIVGRLAKDLLMPVGTGIIIAAPVAGWLMHEWLQNYATRIALPVEVFALGTLVALLVAIVTISFQAIKAGMMNPVKSLRME